MKRMFVRNKVVFGLFVLLALFSLGRAVAAEQRVLTVGMQYDAKNLDPITVNEMASSVFNDLIYDTLLTLDIASNPTPALAESWELGDREIKFYLRKGVKFHNGEEMKASDVKYSIDRACGPLGGAYKVFVETIEGVDIIDDYTIMVRLKEPNTAFFGAFSLSWGCIVNKKAVEEAGEDYGMNPVGTGPFKLVDWMKNYRATFEKFSDFWGPEVKLDKVIIRPLPEQNSRMIELESGGIDLAFPIFPVDIKRVSQNPKLKLMRGYENSMGYFGLNCSKPPFDNPKVRKALYLALDTEAIRMVARGETATGASGPLFPKVKYYKARPLHEQNVEMAKTLLKESGVELPINADVYIIDTKERLDAVVVAQNQLEEIGIELKVNVMEWGSYLDALKSKKHDMYMMGWFSTVPDPHYVLAPVFHSSMAGVSNYTYFADPEVDKLLDEGKKTPDGPDREKIYYSVIDKVDAAAPWVYLWYNENFFGLKKSLEGFVPRAGIQSFRTVYFIE